MQRELARTLDRLAGRSERNQLALYRASGPQAEFHAAGARFRERLLMASNQSGKSFCGSREVAMHLTGRYPADWKGKRFTRPNVWLAGSETGELTRKGIQRLLLGDPADEKKWGTGAIPADCIVDWARASGAVPDLLDYIVVKFHNEAGDHIGNSVIYLKNYQQGRRRWQADTVDGVWFDEEPPLEIYTEGITRTNITMGPIMLTFTPLMGQSRVVLRFIQPAEDDLIGARHRTVVNMTLETCGLYTPEQIEQIVASYPEHERDARTKGIPVLGSGLVWPFHEQDYLEDPFQRPDHWAIINGMDFGYDHPFGAAQLWIDRDADRVFVARTASMRLMTPREHCDVLREWDKDIAGGKDVGKMPWSWPGDGARRDKDPSGEEFAKLYAGELNILPERAQFEDGGVGLEAGVMDIYDRLRTKRWRVIKGATSEWVKEQRGYHRKDGLIVKLQDDVLSASRYAHMMRRFAVVPRLRRTGPQFYNRQS